MREPDYVHHLLTDADSEVAYRAVISRAYYAAFHLAMDLAIRTAFKPGRGATDHRLIREHISGQPIRHARVLASRLDTLRRLRNRADYELFRPVNRDLAIEAVEVMDEVLEAIGVLPASLPRP